MSRLTAAGGDPAHTRCAVREPQRRLRRRLAPARRGARTRGRARRGPGPRLDLLHPLLGAQVRDLAVDHRVIAYDQRGHGRTPAAGPGGYSTDGARRRPGGGAGGHPRAGREGRARRALHGRHDADGRRRAARRSGTTGRPCCCAAPAARGWSAESLVLPLRAGAPAHPADRGGPRRARAARSGQRRVEGDPAVRHDGPGSAPERVEACARIVHACPRGARVAWGHVLAELDLEARLRELRLPDRGDRGHGGPADAARARRGPRGRAAALRRAHRTGGHRAT